MTAVLSPQPPKAASPSAQQSASSSTRQSQPQPQSPTKTEPTPTPTSSTSTSTSSSNTTTKSSVSSSQHLSAPGDSNATSSSPSHSSSKPRSRSRGSNGATPSRSRNSVLSTSTRTSSVFPSFPSSLSYALVRDFAYPAFHPLHYGPQESSHRNSHRSRDSDGIHDDAFSYPYGDRGMGGDRRLSDPPPNWEASKGMWAAGPWGGDGGAVYGSGDQLPSTSFGYDSDEGAETGERETSGLLSKNHRKSKSMATGDDAAARRRRNEKSSNKDKSDGKQQRKDNSHLGTGLDSQGFFQAGATDEEDGDEAEHAKAAYGWQVTASPTSELASSRNAAQNHHSSSQYFGESQNSEADQQDEAFAGPSLALYTFQPENANELALKEGQIIQVGYRHGQGWLVAMDLETGEQGLVPEEYVRLLRDIDGWGEDEDMDLGDDGEEEEGEGEGDDESGPAIGGEESGPGGREVKMGEVEHALGEPGGRDRAKEKLQRDREAAESPLPIPDRTKDKGRTKGKA